MDSRSFSLRGFPVFLTSCGLVHLSSDLPQHAHRHIVFRGCFQDELGIGGPAFDFLTEVSAQLREVVEVSPSSPDP